MNTLIEWFWSSSLTLNCIILQIILCVYNLQGKKKHLSCCNLVLPAGQLLRVDAYEAEEADNHDGDETVKDVIPAILCQRIVPAVRQVGQKKSWKEGYHGKWGKCSRYYSIGLRINSSFF